MQSSTRLKSGKNVFRPKSTLRLNVEKSIIEDDSSNASYALELELVNVCKKQIKDDYWKYRRQFAKEIKRCEYLQTSALDGVIIDKLFFGPVCKDSKLEKVKWFTPTEQIRLNELLRVDN